MRHEDHNRGACGGDAPLTPWRALIEPAWLTALGVLLVNDHVLKAAWPGVVTGKLSDVAGLFLAPALLATLLGVRERRGLTLSALAIAAVFGAINLSPAAAAWWDGAMSGLLLPFATTPDVTDLLALPALWLGVMFASHASARRRHGVSRHRLAMLTACAGALASAASGVPVEGRAPAQFTGQVTILNRTNELHEIEISELRDGVTLDCGVVAEDPGRLLNDELFDSGLSPWLVPLFSGEELSIDPNTWSNNWEFDGGARGACRAFLVRSAALPDVLVFWQTQDMVTRTYYHNADVPQELAPAQQTIAIEADYSAAAPPDMHEWREHTCPLPDDEWGPEVEWAQCDALTEEELTEAARAPLGTRYTWRSVFDQVPLHFERPRFEEGEPLQIPARCETPGPGEGLAWEKPPAGTYLVEGVRRGLDGCHAVLFEGGDDWLVCAPWEAIAPLAGEEQGAVDITITEQLNTNVSEQLTIDVLAGSDQVGYRQALFLRGTRFEPFLAINWEEEIRTGCSPIVEECGQVAMPVDLRVDAMGTNLLVEPGESVELGAGRELFVVRAGYRPVADSQCGEDGAGAQTGSFVEAILTLE